MILLNLFLVSHALQESAVENIVDTDANMSTNVPDMNQNAVEVPLEIKSESSTENIDEHLAVPDSDVQAADIEGEENVFILN